MNTFCCTAYKIILHSRASPTKLLDSNSTSLLSLSLEPTSSPMSKTSISLAVPSATPPPPPPPPPQSPPSPPSPTLSSPPASPDLPSVPPMSLLVSEESDPSGQLWQFSDNDIQSSSDIDDCDYNYPKSKDLLTQGLNPSSRNDVISSKSSFPLADILASMRKCRVFWRDHTGALNDDIAHIVSPPEQGDDILHFACRYGQLHRLRNLIERTNDLNSRNAVNKTPLHEGMFMIPPLPNVGPLLIEGFLMSSYRERTDRSCAIAFRTRRHEGRH